MFNGTDNKLHENMHVLVEGKSISGVSAKKIAPPEGATVIDGGGKTLMPGLIDGHTHIMINGHFDSVEKNMDLTDIAYRADAGFSPKTTWDRSNFEHFGIGAVADGVPQVLEATRINLRNGATQIKIMAGGGGSSRFDPIDTTQYSKEEICAIVEAAPVATRSGGARRPSAATSRCSSR